jgi:hypothetical protein
MKSKKEVNAVMALDNQARFRHFLKQVVDFEQAWSLWSRGWGLMALADQSLVLPLWPAEEYAMLCKSGQWESYEATPIQFHDLINDLLPSLAEDGILCGVFPTPAGDSITLKPSELIVELRRLELEYYG